MSDTRESIDRVGERFPFPEDAFDRMVGRRDRKRRNQRIQAATVAAVLVAAMAGAFLSAYLRSDPYVPARPVISPSNVSTLRLTWSADLDGPVSGRQVEPGTLVYPPTLAENVVYVGTEAGTLYAFPAACEASCAPLWTGSTDGSIIRAPVVGDGLVYVATDRGKLYAFASECAGVCEPVWVGDVGGRLGASPVVANGFVYGVDVDSGTLYAFRDHCVADAGGRCAPAWQATYFEPDGSQLDRENGYVIEGELTPTVVGDQVFVIAQTGRSGDLFAFDVGTGALQWRSNIGGGSHYLARPVVTGGNVFAGIGLSSLYAFPQRCGSGGAVCAPTWESGGTFWEPHADTNDTLLGPLAASNGKVFASCCFTQSGHAFAFDGGGNGDVLWQGEYLGAGAWNYPIVAGDLLVIAGDGTLENGADLSAFPIDCGTGGGACAPIWTAGTDGLSEDVLHPATPTVMGRVVFAGTTNGEVVAYPARCTTALCPPAWHWSSGDAGDALSTPAAGPGAIYVAQASGHLLAFAPSPG